MNSKQINKNAEMFTSFLRLTLESTVSLIHHEMKCFVCYYFVKGMFSLLCFPIIFLFMKSKGANFA